MLPGDVCIFNVLYQIDVFWGRDEGITTEAIHNAIKCTVAFRRIQYTDWKQWWYRRNCLSWFIKVWGEYYCAEIMFLYTLVYGPHLNVIWRTYWRNCRKSGGNCSGSMFWLLWIKDKFYVVIFQRSKFCKGKGSDAVKERLFLSRREKTTYRIFVWLSNFWGCPGIHSGHDR